MKKFMTVLAVVALVAFAAPAFAANPFADVPAGHWAYDAVAQLAADGLISGYPDGAFKGGQKATRYEVAAMVARATAKCESGIAANKKDIELLKKLMVEFKDELDALGAKTDKLDKRVTKLEKGIGSWKISGRFKFDVNFTGGDQANGNSAWTGGRGKYNMTRDYARMFFRRQITEDTYFDSQFRLGSDWAGADNGNGMNDSSAFSVRKFYVGTKLPFWGLGVKIGRSQFDFESDYNLYTDEDASFGDWRMDGFWFTKNWKTVKADFIFGRNGSGDKRFYEAAGLEEVLAGYAKGKLKNHAFIYALNLKWTPNDKFTAGLMGYWLQGDGANASNQYSWEGEDGKTYKTNISYGSVQTYGLTLGYNFTPNVALKGVYYWQRYGKGAFLSKLNVLDDNQHLWKVILDIKQDALKFTDLWIEYASYSNGFGGNNGAAGGVNNYSMGGLASEPGIQWVRPINNQTSKIWFIKAEQKWNKKWSTFLRYNYGNWGTDNLDNAWDWGVGVKYKLNPAITFMLAYDQINYGDKTADKAGLLSAGDKGWTGKDSVIFFQTDVKF